VRLSPGGSESFEANAEKIFTSKYRKNVSDISAICFGC
jgi:hypothetical protein